MALALDVVEAGHDVFLNYAGRSPRDRQWTERLATSLLAYGVRPWVAERDLHGFSEQAWAAEVEAAIASVPAFAACIGGGAIGQWGRKEQQLAAGRAEREPTFKLVPVLMPGGSEQALASLPAQFRSRPWVDLRRGVANPTQLVAVLRGLDAPVSLVTTRADVAQRVVRELSSGKTNVVAVVGPAGVGKTTIVNAAARELASGFPGGVVFVPVGDEDAASVAARALVGLGEPEAVDGAAVARLQARLAERRTLVVLEDVEGAEGVDAILAPTPSATIVVSRASIDVLHLPVVVAVAPLAHDEARELLHQLVPGLAQAEPEAAEAVVDACGGLPVRLQLAAYAAAQAGSLAAVLPSIPLLDVGEPTHAPRLERPGYAADSIGGADRLEITGDVKALCSLIAAREVKPPLSIGLFAEWGTGKSFFIDKLREEIQTRAESSGDEGPWCSRVKQITFNAWHYADANLWASLVTRIFEALAEEGTAPLLERIDASRLGVAAAEEAERAAQEEIDEAEAERERLLLERVEKRASLRRVRLADVEELARDAEVRRAAAELTSSLRTRVSPDEIGELAKRLGTLRGKLAKLRELLPTWSLAPLGLALVVAVVLAVVFPAWIGAVAAAASGVTWLLTAAAGPLRTVANAATIAQRGALQLVDAESAAARQQEEERLTRDLERLRQQEALQRTRAAEARAQLAVLEQERDDLRTGRALYRFIEERAGADDYRRHLGLVALVRQDFETLAKLLEPDPDAELPPVERIVLYVDDLDRCSAHRVVKVLEAVHLLLALRLFVVVVAVDPRWLLRSLEWHYRHELAAGVRPEGPAREWTSTPQNYLEKIFQIPFALSPMESQGYGRLIQDLFGLEGSPSDGPPEPADVDGSVGGEAATPDIVFAPAPHRPDPSPDGGSEVESLVLTRPELEFVQLLSPIVRTPRAAKRLVNTYRLIRATLGEDRLLGAGVGGGYREVLLLLGVLIGTPGVAEPLFEQISARVSPTWQALETSFVPPHDQVEAWGRVRAAIAQLSTQAALPQPIFGYARWVPTVSRYSFQTARLAGPAPTGDPVVSVA